MNVMLRLNSEEDTDEFGRILAEHLPRCCVVALNGTLGAGKTRLTQGLAKACGVPVESVTSPTFTLWQTYHGNRVLHHLDAYRIADEDEFDALGVEEHFETEAVTLIEWASRIDGCLPAENRLEIELEVISENCRSARIHSESAAFDELGVALASSALAADT